MIVLDTNIVSESSKRAPDANVEAWFKRQRKPELHLCGPVVMEQAYGAQRAFLRTGTERYFRVLNDMISADFRGRILAFDGAAPELAGRLRAIRDKAGRPLGIGDAMIAAICIVHDATLATRNLRDFDGLDLKLVNPFEAGA